MENMELYHHGVKGMKWGVRRKRKSVDNTHEDYRRAHNKTDVKNMSDKELRDRNNRLQMERQYSDLTRKTGKGKKAVNAIIATAATIAALDKAYETYTKVGGKVVNKALDKYGDQFVGFDTLFRATPFNL